MTHAQFAAALAELQLTQTGFRNVVYQLSGEHLAPSTTTRWTYPPGHRDHRAVPAPVAALLSALAIVPAAVIAELASADPASVSGRFA